MRTYPFAVAAILALAVASSPRAAEKPKQADQNQPKKVWTNEDLDRLHAEGLISYFAPESGNAPGAATSQAQPESQAATTTPQPLPPKLQDPEWYRQQASDLQMQLDIVQAELQLDQQGLAQAQAGVTKPGISMAEGNVGITPDAGIAIREAQVQQIQSQLDALADLARQNNIPPGALRG